LAFGAGLGLGYGLYGDDYGWDYPDYAYDYGDGGYYGGDGYYGDNGYGYYGNGGYGYNGYGGGYPADAYASSADGGGCYLARQRVHTRSGWHVRNVEVCR
jgi:hypothetical protein